MRRTRLLFSKTGRAKYISHLDLMRTFQRVFLRADVKLRHTEGFNPHPYMNFALPLSLGMESVCELMDFDMTDDIPLDMLPARLNRTMPKGITVLKAYTPAAAFTEIKWLGIEGQFIYDHGAGDATVLALTSLFKEKELIVSKKSKRGFSETDIIPLIHSCIFKQVCRGEIVIYAVLTAQNPSLNPDNLTAAVKKYIPTHAPDFVSYKRIEIFDGQHHVFR